MYFEFQGYAPNDEYDSYVHIALIEESVRVTAKVEVKKPYEVRVCGASQKNKVSVKVVERDTYWSYLEKMAGVR